MGEARNKNQRFLAANPFCIFCGGNEKATTIEHCPPRAMFQGYFWPEGFEFPACDACNGGTRDKDLLVAFLARLDPFDNKGDGDGKLVGMMKRVNSRYPSLLQRMMPTAVEARQVNKRLGIKPPLGLTHQEAGVVHVPDEMHDAVTTFAAKLAKGVYFQASQKPFPADGELAMHWFTNVELVREGKYKVFDLFSNIAGVAPKLERSGKLLNDQFEYKFSASDGHELFMLQVRVGRSFGMVVFGSAHPGKIEAIMTKLREATGRDGPFTMLQRASAAQTPQPSLGLKDERIKAVADEKPSSCA